MYIPTATQIRHWNKKTYKIRKIKQKPTCKTARTRLLQTWHTRHWQIRHQRASHKTRVLLLVKLWATRRDENWTPQDHVPNNITIEGISCIEPTSAAFSRPTGCRCLRYNSSTRFTSSRVNIGEHTHTHTHTRVLSARIVTFNEVLKVSIPIIIITTHHVF